MRLEASGGRRRVRVCGVQLRGVQLRVVQLRAVQLREVRSFLALSFLALSFLALSFLTLSFLALSFLAFSLLAFGFFAACSFLSCSFLALSFLALSFLTLSFLALSFATFSFLAFSFLAFGFFAACSFLALSFLALSFLTLSFLVLSFLSFSFAAFSFAMFSFLAFSFAADGLATVNLAVLFDRLPAVGAVVCGLARFGGPAPFVAGVRCRMTRAVVLYSPVVVLPAMGLSVVPLGVSVAVASGLVPGAAAFLAAALPGMLFAIPAGHGAVVAVILLQREQFGHGAGRSRENADEPDCAQRGKKAAPSTVGRDEGAVRAISFQFQSPSRIASYELGVNFR
jgi:hypothetical protein